MFLKISYLVCMHAISNVAAHGDELLAAHGYELEQLKLFFLIVFGLYLTFGRRVYIYNMKKSLLGCEQITLVIKLYPETKFELICRARKTSKSNLFLSANKMRFNQTQTTVYTCL